MRLTSHALLAVLASAPPSAAGFAPCLVGSVSKCRTSTPSSSAPLAFSPARRTAEKKGPLFGIMDEVNSDSFDLLGKSKDADASGPVSKDISDAYEIFLAELIFSPNDPRLDIVEKLDLAGDDKFLDWLYAKAGSSTDPEERMALRDLHGMIVDVKQKIELTARAEERERAEAEEAERKRLEEAEDDSAEGRAMSDTDVLRRAARVDTAAVDAALKEDSASGKKKESFLESEISPEIRISYEGLVKDILPPYKPGDTVASVVFNLYDRCDAQLMKVLQERAANGDGDSQAVIDAIAEEQSKRLAAATERLKGVLAMGEPMKMEGAIVKLARDGGIDEPFLLLLEANANQAAEAGAQGPAQLMRKLRSRAMEEKDKQSSSKEIKLLRKLLRTEVASEREKLLEDAFTPREQLLVEGNAANAQRAIDGEAPEEEKPMPDVTPPDFINACKAVLVNFGNLGTDEKGDLTTMVKTIASEAEVVATRIYGKGMSPREQQDRMYKEQTTSIFDLETMEIQAEQMGDVAPWANPDNDDILPGFDADGTMKVGGS